VLLHDLAGARQYAQCCPIDDHLRRRGCCTADTSRSHGRRRLTLVRDYRGHLPA
jgi:hypothetical protein